MRKNNKQVTTYFILFSLLLIGVVYAILQANLQINGVAKIQANTWDIHFDNIRVNENSVSIGTGDSAATIDPENNCKVDFEVTLSTPGDFYEFTVDVVNAGTIDAMINSIQDSFKVDGVDSSIPNFINYTVTYESGASVEPKHKLDADTTETYKVRIEYKTDIEELASASTLSMSFEVIYVQADDTSIIIDHPVNLYHVFEMEAARSSDYVLEYTGSHKDSFTENGNKKIYYFYTDDASSTNPKTGVILNNKWNVLFGGFCWQMFRTTDTGGVKLIYNGIPSKPLGYNDYTIVTNDNFIWDNSSKTWNLTITDGSNKEISFTVPAGDNYKLSVIGTTGRNTGGAVVFYKDGSSVNGSNIGGGMGINLLHNFETLTSSNVIKVSYLGSSSIESPITLQIALTQVDSVSGTYCHNTRDDQAIGLSPFNTNDNSPAYVGYQYGPVYTLGYTKQTGWKYAPDVSYDTTTGKYTLISKNGYNIEEKTSLTDTNLNYQHYTCGSSTETTCSEVYYVYYVYNNTAYYITLVNGKQPADVLDEMLTASNVNQTDSTAKVYIDTWYQNNLANYSDRLEDVIFCNDREIVNLSDSGWNPDGGSNKVSLRFKGASSGSYEELTCTNVTDQFSMHNSSAKLTYPIGLMTISESRLLSFISLVVTGNYYWYLSPANINFVSANNFGLMIGGYTQTTSVNNNDGIRPVVSLKSGTRTIGGNGSRSRPYIVE